MEEKAAPFSVTFTKTLRDKIADKRYALCLVSTSEYVTVKYHRIANKLIILPKTVSCRFHAGDDEIVRLRDTIATHISHPTSISFT